MPLSRRNVLFWFQLLFLSVLPTFVDFFYAFLTQMIWASFSFLGSVTWPVHIQQRALFTVIKSTLIGCGLVTCQRMCGTNSYKYSFVLLIISISQSVGSNFFFTGTTNWILDVTDSVPSIKTLIWKRKQCFFQIGYMELSLLYETEGTFYTQVNSDWLVTNSHQIMHVHLWFACVQNICTCKKMTDEGIALKFITTRIIKAHSNQLTSPQCGDEGI